MATSYPGAIDTFGNPGPTTAENASGLEHDVQHANANDAIEAIEAELGVNPSGDSSTVAERFSSLIPWLPDKPPTSPTSYDYEFDGSGTSLPSGWSWMNQGSSTYLEKNGSGYLNAQSSSGYNNRVIYRSIATDASFEYRAKFRFVSIRNANYFQTGFYLTDGTKLIVCGYDNRGAKYVYWNSVTSYNTESGGLPLMLGDTLYLSLRKNSSSSWDIGYSTDGEFYQYYYSAVNFSTFMTPTGIGFGYQNESNFGFQTIACDWIRKVA